MATKKSTKGVQTGRNLPSELPNKYRSYTPRSRQKTPQSPPDTPGDLEAVSKSRWKQVLKWSILAIVILVIAVVATIAAWDVHNISSAEKKLFGTGNVMSLINSGGLATDSNGRVNVLIAGDSVDDPGHAGAKLTDSILLISLNPSDHTGYMLSIPRDLYVNIPGYGHAKINSAYSDGGLPLLQQVVEQDFGMKVSYDFLVDYHAVKDIVDALGGINVNVKSLDDKYSDPEGKLYDPDIDYATHGILVDLTPGNHRLSGEQALDFTRARGEAYGSIGFNQADFQRTADQREVVAAIKSKLSWHLVLNPRKNGIILNAIAANIKTNTPASAARPLFGLYNSIPNAKMKSYSLRSLNGKNYLSSLSTYAGDSLVPAAGIDDFSQIQAVLDQLNQ